MKALVIADRRPATSITRILQQQPIELIITLGDLTRDDLLPLEHITDIPKIGVYGNHDSGTYMPELGIWNLHMATWQWGGLSFGGFEGCVRYKPSKTAIMYTQAEATELLRSFPPVDIMITHCPPRGINDEAELAHQGFDALRQYLTQHSPQLLLHGHTYPTADSQVRSYHRTRITYVHGAQVVDITPPSR